MRIVKGSKMNAGKSISLFLMNGMVDGIVAVELFNWTGKGYKIPRPRIKDQKANRFAVHPNSRAKRAFFH
jgi:hypothetical protein